MGLPYFFLNLKVLRAFLSNIISSLPNRTKNSLESKIMFEPKNTSSSCGPILLAGPQRTRLAGFERKRISNDEMRLCIAQEVNLLEVQERGYCTLKINAFIRYLWAST